MTCTLDDVPDAVCGAAIYKSVDRRTAKEKAIDDWLPITSSREAKWWYSAFHNVTAMVGAGVLSLPYAMSELGWGPGVAALVISWVVTLYTLWQMVEMHEMVPGRRFDSYSTIAWTASIKKRVQPDVEYGYKVKSTAGTVFGFFSALGDVAFAYAGHNVVLEIQATMPSTPEKPSKGPMWKGVVLAYIVVALCYFPVALIGYWMYGNAVSDNILISLKKPTWLIAMANLFVVLHVIGDYQMYAMPVFDMIETVLVKKLKFAPKALRFFSRNLYVAFTMIIGICFPFFGGLLGFFGGFLPCVIMWLAIYKPKKFSLSWITNWVCIIMGVLR